MNWQTLIEERLGIVPVAALGLYYPITNGAEELRQFRCLHRLPLASQPAAIAGPTRFHANSGSSRADRRTADRGNTLTRVLCTDCGSPSVHRSFRRSAASC